MNMQTRERIARTAAWAAAGLGLGLAASAQASGVTLRPVRPRAEPLRAPVSITPRIKRPTRRATIRRHISCVSWRRPPNGWWADAVHLTNDGQTAIPPGTMVYWYMRNDRRIWGARTFAGGLARGASAFADTHAPVAAGTPCTVVFHRPAWMISHPVAPRNAIRRATRGIAPLGGKSKPGIQAKRQHPYALTCKVMTDINPGTQERYYRADIANSGPWIVPEGAIVDVRADGMYDGSRKLTAPLREGQHFGFSLAISQSYSQGAALHTCSARIR